MQAIEQVILLINFISIKSLKLIIESRLKLVY